MVKSFRLSFTDIGKSEFTVLKRMLLIQPVISVFTYLQIKRADTAFFWEEREIMANANSEWIVQVMSNCIDLNGPTCYL